MSSSCWPRWWAAKSELLSLHVLLTVWWTWKIPSTRMHHQVSSELILYRRSNLARTSRFSWPALKLHRCKSDRSEGHSYFESLFTFSLEFDSVWPIVTEKRKSFEITQKSLIHPVRCGNMIFVSPLKVTRRQTDKQKQNKTVWLDSDQTQWWKLKVIPFTWAGVLLVGCRYTRAWNVSETETTWVWLVTRYSSLCCKTETRRSFIWFETQREREWSSDIDSD